MRRQRDGHNNATPMSMFHAASLRRRLFWDVTVSQDFHFPQSWRVWGTPIMKQRGETYLNEPMESDNGFGSSAQLIVRKC